MTEPLSFRSNYGIIHILPGWETDGASIPRPFRWFACPFSGPYTAAAIIHDALYRSQLLSRAQSDLVFFEAMTASGYSGAWIMYHAVRAFGWNAWNDNRDSIPAFRQYVEIIK